VRHGQAAEPGAAHASAEKSPPKAETKALYYCPMHPTYTANRPGPCPICGMDLVPAKAQDSEPAGQATEGRTAINISPTRRQMIGVQLGKVEKKRMTKTIRAFGRVEYNENMLAAVNLKYGGWVEELMVKAVGDPVQKGAALFSIYSPELLEAQRNYLLAREGAAAMKGSASPESGTLAQQG